MKNEVKNNHKLKINFAQKKKKLTRNNSKKDNMREIEIIREISKRRQINLKNNSVSLLNKMKMTDCLLKISLFLL